MLPGETILSGAPSICPGCDKVLEFQVLHSSAGYYIGTLCNCGPYSRETDYFRIYDEARNALKRYRETGILDRQR